MSKKITKSLSLKSISAMTLFTLSIWGVLSCGIGASFSPSFFVLGFVFASLCAFLVRCSNPSTDTDDTVCCSNPSTDTDPDTDDTMMPDNDTMMPDNDTMMPEFLDAFVANRDQANRIYLNNGMGGFPATDITDLNGMNTSRGVALGDLDGDGNLDAFVANSNNQANRIYLNNGMGGFPDAGITDLNGMNASYGVALGDLDGDGDLDAFVANYDEPNRIYLNNGMGGFPDAGITDLNGMNASYDVALGDLDGDGDLDAFVANYDESNRIYINNGITSGVWGGFATSAPLTGRAAYSYGVALGDLDGDGDLDAFVANSNNQANRIYINNGVSTSGAWEDFAASAALNGMNASYDVALGDLDDDGDLDAFVANRNQPNRIYLNNGMGGFPATDITDLNGMNDSREIALGDLDGDGDLDAFVVNRDQPNRIYLNNGVSTSGAWGGFAASAALNGMNDSQGVALGDLGGN